MLLNFAVLVTVAVTGQRRFGAGHMNQMFDRMQRAQQDSYESTIPGGPGVDYPTFSVPPPTSFSCQGLVQATTLTRRLTARCTTCAVPRTPCRPSPACSAPTALSTTSSTSSATGGSMSTAA